MVAAGLFCLLAERLQLLAELPVHAVAGGEVLSCLHGIAHEVEHVGLEHFVGQQEVLVLRVYVDDARAQCLQLGKGGWRVVDKGTALACIRKFSSDSTFLILNVEIVLDKEFLQVESLEAELGFDDAFACTLPDVLGVGPLS